MGWRDSGFLRNNEGPRAAFTRHFTHVIRIVRTALIYDSEISSGWDLQIAATENCCLLLTKVVTELHDASHKHSNMNYQMSSKCGSIVVD